MLTSCLSLPLISFSKGGSIEPKEPPLDPPLMDSQVLQWRGEIISQSLYSTSILYIPYMCTLYSQLHATSWSSDRYSYRLFSKYSGTNIEVPSPKKNSNWAPRQLELIFLRARPLLYFLASNILCSCMHIIIAVLCNCLDAAVT